MWLGLEMAFDAHQEPEMLKAGESVVEQTAAKSLNE